MAAKAPENAIVTYRSFGQAFDRAAGRRLTERSPFESAEDPAEDTVLRAELSAALAVLEGESARQGPGMMAAVPNQLASLLQSRMLEAPPPGDLQALYAAATGGECVRGEVRRARHSRLGRQRLHLVEEDHSRAVADGSGGARPDRHRPALADCDDGGLGYRAVRRPGLRAQHSSRILRASI